LTSDGVKSIRAVERAADVLLCLAHHGGPVGITELQNALALSRPTLYRLLAALERKALVRSFGDPQRFALDYGVGKIAGTWLGSNDVVVAAQPHLTALWQETDETVALCLVADVRSKICVQELRSRQALVFTRGTGFTEPLSKGSSGKAILAFMAADEIERVLAAEPDTMTQAALGRDLERICRDGYARSTGEIISGACAMAAPVFDGSRRVCASVSVFGPAARLTGAHHEDCLRRLRKAADRISAAIGYRAGAAAE
jgi:DNA-binding IclR family transcriptional regulator